MAPTLPSTGLASLPPTVDYEARRAGFKKTPFFSDRPQTEHEWREGLLHAQRSSWRVERLEALRAQSLRELCRLTEDSDEGPAAPPEEAHEEAHDAAQPDYSARGESEAALDAGAGSRSDSRCASADAEEALRAAGLPAGFAGRDGGRERKGTGAWWRNKTRRNRVDRRAASQQVPDDVAVEASMDAEASPSAGRLHHPEEEEEDVEGDAQAEMESFAAGPDAAQRRGGGSRGGWNRRRRGKPHAGRRAVSSFAGMLAIPTPIVIPQLAQSDAGLALEAEADHGAGAATADAPHAERPSVLLPGFASAAEDWFVYLRPEGRRCLLVMNEGMGAVVDKRGVVRALLHPQPFHARFEEEQRRAVDAWHRERAAEGMWVDAAEGANAATACVPPAPGEGAEKKEREKKGLEAGGISANSLFRQPAWAACPRCLSSWLTSGWGSCARGFTALECVWANSHDLRWHDVLSAAEEAKSVQEKKILEVFLERQQREREHGGSTACACCCFSLLFVTDVLWWNDCMLGQAQTACRQFFLRSRFEEMDGGASLAPLQLLPFEDCSVSTLQSLYYQQLQPWPSDSLIFLHREAPYVEALSDFCLSWRDAHLSRFHLDERLGPGGQIKSGDAEKQVICLRVTKDFQLATEDGIVLSSPEDEARVRELGLRPREIVRCSVDGVTCEGETRAVEGLCVVRRVRLHVRRQADAFTRVLDQFLKRQLAGRTQAHAGSGEPFAALLVLLFGASCQPRYSARAW
ncbi:hypothetical protein BESB_065270 [Besnoitia besnoiti]|uniref:Snurportin-1 n=1 Tax=Besnoitia besnoiti TaxID=94643 RepID=A0A2A9M924_BESBE|nr:hypothetical protein BESB_065270 [Besnoitia besnoiti]PFH34495.1 hypothetical protein BESB_065270 [Besnoitia besnoiti]